MVAAPNIGRHVPQLILEPVTGLRIRSTVIRNVTLDSHAMMETQIGVINGKIVPLIKKALMSIYV